MTDKNVWVEGSDGRLRRLDCAFLYQYIKEHEKDDPLDILKNPHNQYAIELSLACCSEEERKEKLARE